jgi:hypothetical protein
MQDRLRSQGRQDEADAQATEAAIGRYGSGLTTPEWQELSQQNQNAQLGIDQTQFIMDVVEQTTPGQLATRSMAKVRGRIESAVYGQYKQVQAMSESKASTLRKHEQEAIDSFLGSPGKFVQGILSQDAATIEKLATIQEIARGRKDASRLGLDEKTIGLLDEASMPNPKYNNWTPPKNAVIRDAAGGDSNSLEAGQAAREAQSGGVIGLLEDAYSGYRGEDWNP